MPVRKIYFFTEINDAYPNTRGTVSIIGKLPEDSPYLSIRFTKDGNESVAGWIADKDLERLAVNILKALKSKKLNHGK